MVNILHARWNYFNAFLHHTESNAWTILLKYLRPKFKTWLNIGQWHFEKTFKLRKKKLIVPISYEILWMVYPATLEIPCNDNRN